MSLPPVPIFLANCFLQVLIGVMRVNGSVQKPNNTALVWNGTILYVYTYVLNCAVECKIGMFIVSKHDTEIDP